MDQPVPSDEAPTSCAASEDIAGAMLLALVSGIGPRLRQALLERFGTPAGVFAASTGQLLSVPGIGRTLAENIRRGRDELDVAEEIALCSAAGVSIVIDADPAYPRLLREIPDPPGVLFVRGRLLSRDGMSVAIVGSRHATSYGLAQATRLAASLAQAGMTITSGLARGIDAAAHQGALDAGGRTLAVCGSGLAHIYPPEHNELAAAIADRGALLSESPMRMVPMGNAFPKRNRLISGLSLGVIVVEAAERSGALITARHALDQGREVFAVPGRVDNRLSRGCHQLLRDGAKLVESADDVLDELGPLVEPAVSAEGHEVHRPAELLLNDIEQRVLGAVTREPISVDAVVVASELPVAKVLSTVSVLEMRRLVRRLSGNQLVRL